MVTKQKKRRYVASMREKAVKNLAKEADDDKVGGISEKEKNLKVVKKEAEHFEKKDNDKREFTHSEKKAPKAKDEKVPKEKTHQKDESHQKKKTKNKVQKVAKKTPTSNKKVVGERQHTKDKKTQHSPSSATSAMKEG